MSEKNLTGPGLKPATRMVVLAAWLLTTAFCLWFEGSRILQLADTPAGVLGWFSAWNADTTCPLLVLLTLPLLAWMFPRVRRSGRTENPRTQREWAAGYPVTIGLSLVSLMMSVAIGFRQIPLAPAGTDTSVTVPFYKLPPAYHDEYSYLVQAETFLAGRVAWPAMTTGGDVFHQIHVLNRPVTASRYFPWTGLWMMAFVQAGVPIFGHWLAGAMACGFFHRSLRRLYPPAIAAIGGLLIAVSPGLAVFSNLLLAHHPTLLALSVFLLSFLKFMDERRQSQALIAGIALTLAMLGRPMTAAGFGLPFGLWFLTTIVRSLQRKPSLQMLVPVLAIGTPLLIGFGASGWMNQRITGQWNLSAYQFYTNTWTPRHRFGFANGTAGPPQSSILNKYDQWAENLTPELAVSNVGNRLLASVVWTMGIAGLLLLVPIGSWTCLFADRQAVGARLVAAAIVSLHLVHIPYWYDGILHWHYVFETSPLLIMLAAGGIQTGLNTMQQWIRRPVAIGWMAAFLGAVLIPAWLNAESLWGTSRVTMAIQEQSFSRVRYELFRRMTESAAVQHPCLILIDERRSDPQLSYVVNRPNYTGNVLICRYPDDERQLQELQISFPDRVFYTFDPEAFTLTALPPTR